jgi:hypothetical protein
MELSGQLHVLPLYPQGKGPWYPLDRRLGGLQSRYGHDIEDKNSHPPIKNGVTFECWCDGFCMCEIALRHINIGYQYFYKMSV